MNGLFASRRMSLARPLLQKPSADHFASKTTSNKSRAFERLVSDLSEMNLVPSQQSLVSSCRSELEAAGALSKPIAPTTVIGGDPMAEQVDGNHHHGKAHGRKAEKPIKLRSRRASMPRGNPATAPGTVTAGSATGYAILESIHTSPMDFDAVMQVGAIVEGTLEVKALLASPTKAKKPLLERVSMRFGGRGAKVASIVVEAYPTTSVSSSSSDTVVGRMSTSTSAEPTSSNKDDHPRRKSVGEHVANLVAGLVRHTSSGSKSSKRGYARHESSSSSSADVQVTRVTRPSATADQSFATHLGSFLPLGSPASGSAATATAGKDLQQWLFLPMLPEAPAPLTIADLL